MANLILTRGLPGSGKSTWAAKQPGATRVNRDDLRFELYNKYHGLKKEEENNITTVQRERTLSLLSQGKDVIIDDTNLNGRGVSSWRDLAEDFSGKVQFGIKDFPIDIDECVSRDAARKAAGGRGVGEQVIRSMSKRYMRETAVLPRLPRAITRPVVTPPPMDNRPHGVIFDIDGTLCDVRSVRHHVRPEEGQKRDFHAFHVDSRNCPPNPAVADILRSCQEKGLKVIVVTARDAKYADLTEDWMKKNNLSYDMMFTRSLGDSRPDYETKKDILGRVSKHFDVVHAVDDNPAVIALWKEQKISTTIVPGFDDPLDNPNSPYSMIQVPNIVNSGRCLRCKKTMNSPGVLGPTCLKNYSTG